MYSDDWGGGADGGAGDGDGGPGGGGGGPQGAGVRGAAVRGHLPAPGQGEDTPHLTATANVNILLTGDFFKVDFRFIETCSMINRYGVKCHLCFESRLKSNIRFVTAIILSG